MILIFLEVLNAFEPTDVKKKGDWNLGKAKCKLNLKITTDS